MVVRSEDLLAVEGGGEELVKKRGASILGEYTVGAEVFDAERILWRREWVVPSWGAWVLSFLGW